MFFESSIFFLKHINIYHRRWEMILWHPRRLKPLCIGSGLGATEQKSLQKLEATKRKRQNTFTQTIRAFTHTQSCRRKTDSTIKFDKEQHTPIVRPKYKTMYRQEFAHHLCVVCQFSWYEHVHWDVWSVRSRAESWRHIAATLLWYLRSLTRMPVCRKDVHEYDFHKNHWHLKFQKTSYIHI